MIPKMPYVKLLREITQDQCKQPKDGNDYRWQGAAILATQTAVEDYLTVQLEDANVCALHSKRCTVMPEDIQLVRRIKGEETVITRPSRQLFAPSAEEAAVTLLHPPSTSGAVLPPLLS
jgi:histone H3